MISYPQQRQDYSTRHRNIIRVVGCRVSGKESMLPPARAGAPRRPAGRGLGSESAFPVHAMQPVCAALACPRHIAVAISLLLDLENVANVVDLRSNISNRSVKNMSRLTCRLLCWKLRSETTKAPSLRSRNLALRASFTAHTSVICRNGTHADCKSRNNAHASRQISRCSPTLHQLAG